MHIFYDNDPDGKFACHILIEAHGKGMLLGDDYDLKYQQGDRSKPFPKDIFNSGEHIVFTDYTPGREIVEDLLQAGPKVIILDHHITAIEALEGLGVDGIMDTTKASCELAWEYCYGDKEMPEALKLIGDLDCWRENRIQGYQLALALDLFATSPDSIVWDSLVQVEGLKRMQDIGKLLFTAQKKNYSEKLNKIFKVSLEGKNFLAVNHNERGAWAFEDHPERNSVDGCLSFHWDGKEWVFSIFSDKVDISPIAVKHGGGGHKGAAGFRCDVLPFNLREE